MKNKVKIRKSKVIRRKKKKRIIILSLFLTLIIYGIFIKLQITNGQAYEKIESVTMSNQNNSVNRDKEQPVFNDELDKVVNVTDNVTDKDDKEVIKIKNIIDNSGYKALQDDINADDASEILPKTMYKWNFYRDDGKKVAYLTFDDGPSEHSTEKILDILKHNDIKATFFVLGSSIEHNDKSKDILKRMVVEGHAIGNHGYSHDYSKLYPNRTVDVNAVVEDFKKNDEILKQMLGKDFFTRVVRLPGGHSSWNGTDALDKVWEANGIWQVDWNVLNGDAEGQNPHKDILLNNLKETVSDQDIAIILMHDTDNKKGTVEYLQSAIDYLKSKGFVFRTLK